MNCPHCQTELPSNARFCLNCGRPVRQGSPVDQERYARLAASAPTLLVEKVRAASRLSGERRLVTALYLDVVDSTGLSLRLGTDAWSAVLNRAFDLCTQVIYRYEGTIAHIQDDELLAFFGAPVAHEDDPLRAVRASLDLLSAFQSYDQEFHREHGEHFYVRLSLSTGPVTLGPVGDDLSYDYSALDGTLSHVAHVEATRTPMSVLITEETYRFIKPFFDCTDLGRLETAGGGRSIHVFRVERPKPFPERSRGLEGLYSPMVGRQAELLNLLQLSQLVAAGLGRVVVIQGEPGLGKTRLIAEWKSLSQSAPEQQALRWVEGRCLSYGQRTAYHLLQSLLRNIIGVSLTAGENETRLALRKLINDASAGFSISSRSEISEEVYPFLAALLSVGLEDGNNEQIKLLEPQALQAQILAALRKLLIMLASRQAMVVVLEDFHWADPTSVECLSQLLLLALTEPILFCLAMRPERESPGMRLLNSARETIGSRLIEISLAALSPTESRQLVSNLLSIEALPTDVNQLITTKAEGNPLFVEELIRMLIERGAVFQAEGKWRASTQVSELDIPDSLQGLLLTRIDRLPEDVKHTLRVAAVIGRQFPVKVLEQVLKKEETRGSD